MLRDRGDRSPVYRTRSAMIIPRRKNNPTTQDNRKLRMFNIIAVIYDISKKSQQNLLVQTECLPKIDFIF
jgi:hypothetical protein